MRRSLVIGGTGFIGSHLVQRLAALGDEVHVLARDSSAKCGPARFPGGVTVHCADLENRHNLARCLMDARAERIFHVAAETRQIMARTAASAQRSLANLRTLMNFVEVLSAMANPPEVVVRAGSIAEYGHIPAPYREDDREAPVNPYGASMLAGTHYLGMLAPALPCPIPTARLALVYGPGQSDSYFVAATIRRCLAGERVHVARPHDRRDLIHIDDAVDGLIALAGNPAPGLSVVNVATGIAPRMSKVAERIAAATGADPRLIDCADLPDTDAPSELLCDTTRARDLLGWQSAISWAEGIERTAAHERAANPADLRMAI